MGLQDRTALVTGGGRGIGRAIALALAREGADVAIADLHSAQETAAAVDALGRSGLALQADVSDLDQVRAMFEQLRERFGRLDVLVNNAGILRRGSLDDHADEDWELVMAVNCRGTYYCSREAAHSMRAQGSGRIINISSVAGKVGDITTAPSYGPSKGAINAMTKSFARELAPYSITVNAIAPHAIATEMSAEWSDEKRRAVLAQIPLGRLGTPDEVAAVVVFLASPGAGFITGEILDVNGGYLMD